MGANLPPGPSSGYKICRVWKALRPLLAPSSSFYPYWHTCSLWNSSFCNLKLQRRAAKWLIGRLRDIFQFNSAIYLKTSWLKTKFMSFLGPQSQSLEDFWSSHSSWLWGYYTLQHGITASQGWANVQTEIKSDWDVQPFSHSLSILSHSLFGKRTKKTSVLISIVLVYSHLSLIFSHSSLHYFSLLLILRSCRCWPPSRVEWLQRRALHY